jgi:hypothetical protein
MATTTTGTPSPGLARMGADAERVAEHFPRPEPLGPPPAWQAAKLTIAQHVDYIAEGAGYPTR